MKCQKCSTSNPDGAKFCYRCGSEIVLQTDHTTKDNSTTQINLSCTTSDEKRTEPSCAATGEEKTKPSHTSSDKEKTEPPCTTTGEEKTEPSHTSSDKEKTEPPCITTGEEKTEPSHSIPEENNDTICPFCNEFGCTPMQKSTTETKSNNYKWESGCCGMFLFGPFGLLCGLCGTGSTSKTHNELWWTCTKCGKQHIALADALNKWDAMIESLPMVGVSIGVIGIVTKVFLNWFLALFVRWFFGSGFIASIASALASVVAFVVPLLLVVCGVWISREDFEYNIKQEFGKSINPYLTKEQTEHGSSMCWVSTGIAVVIALLGLPVLNYILGA